MYRQTKRERERERERGRETVHVCVCLRCPLLGMLNESKMEVIARRGHILSFCFAPEKSNTMYVGLSPALVA